ncbi:DUF4253 domain-containing protein [Streptomyces sp. NPDC059378]|uniref:DUF4253 domain-containing protein n=1 Tax=Streptomyces sp. NPDC059378 TaxID=3346815 RepID=UPI0036C3908A
MATLPNPLPALAADPSGRSLGLQLPLGRLIDATDDGPWHEPLLWHAEQPVSAGNWSALGARAGRAGLLPVLLDLGGRQGGPQEWELMPAEVSYPGDHDAEEVLADFWDEYAAAGDEWPGLCPPPARTADPDTRAAEVADLLAEDRTRFDEPHLALVPARRSADIPAAIGWTGPLNYEEDIAVHCAVLRSWEDRFGIRVVALGFDSMAVSVAAPPTTPEQAEAVAAEHFAFCPDTLAQDGPDALQDYAKSLIAAETWYFWWD